MAKALSLTAPEREFVELVSRAAFSNPFSEERDQLDRSLTGTVGVATTREGLLAALIARVSEGIARMEAAGRAQVDRYPQEDRVLIQGAFLFEAYHRYFPLFEKLVEAEDRNPERPCKVPFAGEALGLLQRRGFSLEESLRFFAVFYQLRRAFFFIDHLLVGQSPSVRQLRMHLWNNIFTRDVKRYVLYLWDRLEDFSTLVLGETGTGKGAAAAAIGRSGFIPFDPEQGCFAESFSRTFVAINLSQFPESLIESELFGHRKGSFTGAIEHHDGVFARCSPHGAIFLDELGDISVPVQIKLLQVLQERVYTPVGSHERKRFHGRVIAATNRPLEDLRREGKFRADLYYRLCSDIVAMPSLRQRLQEDPGELDLLVSHLVGRMVGVEVPEISRVVVEEIRRTLPEDYPWPGNVRELEQAVRRSLLVGPYLGDIVAAPRRSSEVLLAAADGRDLDARDVLGAYCRLLYEMHGTYEAVARRSGLDPRTVRKYLGRARGNQRNG